MYTIREGKVHEESKLMPLERCNADAQLNIRKEAIFPVEWMSI